MSLDEGMQEKKQSVLEQASTQRPLSMSFTTPKQGDNLATDIRRDERDSDLSCLEETNDHSFDHDSDVSPSKEKALSRASSVRSMGSNRSFTSTTPSAASGISLSGLSISSSGSRTARSGKGRIIPLYNLAVSHSALQ
jgi:hypothetical protein